MLYKLGYWLLVGGTGMSALLLQDGSSHLLLADGLGKLARP